LLLAKQKMAGLLSTVIRVVKSKRKRKDHAQSPVHIHAAEATVVVATAAVAEVGA